MFIQDQFLAMNKRCAFSSCRYLFLLGIVFIAACSDAAYEPEFVNRKQDATEVLPMTMPSQLVAVFDSMPAKDVAFTGEGYVVNRETEVVSSPGPQPRLVSSSRSGME
jgi:hypothetical protein